MVTANFNAKFSYLLAKILKEWLALGRQMIYQIEELKELYVCSEGFLDSPYTHDEILKMYFQVFLSFLDHAQKLFFCQMKIFF